MSHIIGRITLLSICIMLLFGASTAYAQLSSQMRTLAFAPALQTFSYGLGIGLGVGCVFVGLGIRLSRICDNSSARTQGVSLP